MTVYLGYDQKYIGSTVSSEAFLRRNDVHADAGEASRSLIATGGCYLADVKREWDASAWMSMQRDAMRSVCDTESESD